MTDIKKGGKYIRIIGFVVGICCLVFGLIDILREHVGTGIYSMILGVLVLINEMPIQPIADKLSFIFGDHRVRGIIYCLLSIFNFWGGLTIGTGIGLLIIGIWYLILGFM